MHNKFDEIVNFSGSTNCSYYPTGYSILPDKQVFLILARTLLKIHTVTFFTFSKIQ